MDMREERRRGDQQAVEEEAESQPNWSAWAKYTAKNVRKVVMAKTEAVVRQAIVTSTME